MRYHKVNSIAPPKVERFIMDDLILLPAGPDYKYQYLRFVSECADDIRRTGFSYALLLSTEESFEADMQKISDSRLGIGLPEGYVPESVYWLYRRRGCCKMNVLQQPPFF